MNDTYGHDLHADRPRSTIDSARTVMLLRPGALPQVHSAVDLGCWLRALRSAGVSHLKGIGPWVRRELVSCLAGLASKHGARSSASSLRRPHHASDLRERHAERLGDLLVAVFARCMRSGHRRIAILAVGDELRQRGRRRAALRAGDVHILARALQRRRGSQYEGVVAEEHQAVQSRPDRRPSPPSPGSTRRSARLRADSRRHRPGSPCSAPGTNARCAGGGDCSPA